MSPTILQLLPKLDSGGVERGTLEMVHAIVQHGWTALVGSSGGRLVHEVERLGGTHIELPLDTKNPINIRKNAERLAEVVKTHSVDLIHARSRAPAWSAERASELTSVPFLTTFHGVYGLGPMGAKKSYNAVMTRGARVIAVSEFIKTHMVEHYAPVADHIRLIPRGVDLSKFDADVVSPERMIALSNAWRLPDGGTVLMLPGRLSGWKGHSLLLDALLIFKRDGKLPPLTRCLFVGEGASLEDDLRDEIEAKDLSDVVHLVGHCADMPAAYMVTDLVISASTKPEAFGRTVAEAAAMSRPVIAPDHGAAPEIIVPGVTGWLFTASDPVSLAAKIETALNADQDTKTKMAEAALSRVQSTFDVRHMQGETLAVYEEILNTRSKSAA